MTYYKPAKQISVKEQVQQRGKIGLSLTVIMAFVFLSIVYLMQINAVVAKNYELLSYQKVLKDREEENQKKMVSLTEARSVNNLESAAKTLNLVSVDKISYLKIIPSSFALSE